MFWKVSGTGARDVGQIPVWTHWEQAAWPRADEERGRRLLLSEGQTPSFQSVIVY